VAVIGTRRVVTVTVARNRDAIISRSSSVRFAARRATTTVSFCANPAPPMIRIPPTSDHDLDTGASIPIYRWRQMRHAQFWGRESNKSLISFNIQNCECCAQINNLKSSYHFLKNFSRSQRSLDCVLSPLRNESMQCALYQLRLYFFVFGSLSLTESFQNSLKTRIDCPKLRIHYPKIVCGGGRKKWEET